MSMLSEMTLESLIESQRDALISLRSAEAVLEYLPSHAKQCRCSEINPDPVFSCHIPCDLCAAKRDVREWGDMLAAIAMHLSQRFAR